MFRRLINFKLAYKLTNLSEVKGSFGEGVVDGWFGEGVVDGWFGEGVVGGWFRQTRCLVI